MAYTLKSVSVDSLSSLQFPDGLTMPTPPKSADFLVTTTYSANGKVLAGTDATHKGAWVYINGKMTTILSAANWPSNTPQITGVNDSGEVVGTALINGLYQGFADINGKVTAINVPGSALEPWAGVNGGTKPAMMNSTTVQGVNDSGEIVGSYIDNKGTTHGFTYLNGTYSTIDPAGSTNTSVWGVTTTGELYGCYVNAKGTLSGFTMTPTTTAPVPPAVMHFNVTDKNVMTSSAGTNYTGNIAGITSQFITTSTDSLMIQATTPGTFIQAEKGTETINVQNGTNVIQAGSGIDTITIDARSLTPNTNDIIAGFKAGDSITILGISPTQLTESMFNDMGPAGMTGLTFHWGSSTQPAMSLTLAGLNSSVMGSTVNQSWGGANPTTDWTTFKMT